MDKYYFPYLRSSASVDLGSLLYLAEIEPHMISNNPVKTIKVL